MLRETKFEKREIKGLIFQIVDEELEKRIFLRFLRRKLGLTRKSLQNSLFERVIKQLY